MTEEGPAPAGERLDEAVKRNAATSPDRVALAEEDRRLTYRETVEAVDRLAAAMLTRGVRPGDRVAVFSYACTDAALAFLATTSLGAAYVGISPKYQRRELEHIVGDADPRLTFCLASGEEAARLLDAVRGVATSGNDEADAVVSVQDLLTGEGDTSPGPLEEARRRVTADDPAVVLYTSGSTGAPKGAMISHRSLLKGAEILTQLVPRGPRCLTDYPINHISWVLETCLLTLVLGGTLFSRERFDPSATLRLIETERITVWQGAPTMFFMCLQSEEFEERDLTSVEAVLFFGGPLPVDALQRLGDRTRARLATGWGMTETAGGCTLTDAGADLKTLATTVGRPDPRLELKIVDDAGEQVAPGEPGEIIVRGETVFLGYLNRPDATAEALDPEGFLHTGDIARDRGDGNLELVGRQKEMFKSGGYNVYPTEVELVLGEHPEVAVVGVIPTTDAFWGEVGVAFIAPRSAAAPPSDDSLKSFCKERLANYKVPKRFLIRNDMPILPTGKVDKRALREQLLSEPPDHPRESERSPSSP